MSFVILGLITMVRLVREYLRVGFSGINYLASGLLVVGWVIGHFLAEVDYLLYAFSSPEELSSMRVQQEVGRRNWREAWQLARQAKTGTRLPIRNVLTGVIVAVAGLWIVTSSGSPLASGVVVGLGVRLLMEFWQTTDYQKWYWMFSRQFEVREHQVIRWVWTLLVIWQGLLLLR